jgi:tetratricopeptide (TPR) repeat protein
MRHLSLLLIAVTACHALAQSPTDSLRRRDADEIKLIAQRKVEKGLVDLLNTLSFDDLGEFERKQLIADSYGAGVNKLFFNGDVIVEDDIDPRHTAADKTADLPINKYLGNLDLFYQKSPEPTILFSNLAVSNVKQGDYLYVKVYFTAKFGGKHTQLPDAYQPLLRVAEVRADRQGKKWQTTITRVAFVTPGDSAAATQNDVVLKTEVPVVSGDSTATASAPVLSAEDVAREQERQAERVAQEGYVKLLTEGDAALAAKDYEKALEIFTQAEQRNRYDDLLPRRRIYQIKRAFEQAKQTNNDLIRSYLANAAMARKARNYADAIENLQKAYALKPDSAALGETIQLLNQKSRIKTELDEQFNAGQFALVVKEYTKNIDKDKTNSDYYLGRGQTYLKLNNTDRALKDFTAAIDLDFNNIAALQARAELLAGQGNVPKALADLTSYLNIDKTNADVLARRAELRLQTSNVNGAFADYDKAISLRPGSASFLLARGLLFAETQNLDKAVTDFTAAIQRDASLEEAHYQRGLAYLRLNRPKDAGADFDRVRQLGISTDQQQAIQTLANGYFRKALAQFDSRAHANAVAGFDETIYLQSDLPEAWFFRGEALTALGQLDPAFKSYSTAIRHRAAYPEAFLKRGAVLIAQRQFAQAAQDYRQATLLNPEFYEAMVGAGDALFAMPDYPQAATWYELVRTNDKKIGMALLDKTFANVYNRLGICYMAAKNYPLALAEFSRAIGRDEGLADAYFNRGQAYEKTSSLRSAIADYRKAATLAPDRPRFFVVLGIALRANQTLDEAVTALDQAIALDPKNACCRAEALVNRAECCFAQQLYPEATAGYTAAFGADPAMQTTLTTRNAAFAHLWQRQPDQALPYLNQLVSLPAWQAEAQYAMACARLQQKNPTDALLLFEQALGSGRLPANYVRKDKLLPFCDAGFADSPAFRDMLKRVGKR